MLSDLIVQTSHAEAFGMTLAEAAAMGKPVVATATQGGHQAVIQGQTGLLVPPHSPKRLAGAILQLLDNPVVMEEMGQRARRHAISAFSSHVILQRELAIYQNLLAQYFGQVSLMKGSLHGS